MSQTTEHGIISVGTTDSAAPAEFTPQLASENPGESVSHPQVRVRMKRCVSRFHEGDRNVPFEDFGDHPSSRDGKQSNCKKCRNHYHKLRRQNDPKFYLTHHIATRVRQQLGPEGYPPGFTKNIDSYLGYRMLDLVRTLNEDCLTRYRFPLKEAIKRGYHLDHRHPLSKYDVKHVNSQEFRDCWAISNLWMLPAEVNLAKSDQVLSGDELLKVALSGQDSGPEIAPKPAGLTVDFTSKTAENTQKTPEIPTFRQKFWAKAFS